MGLFSGGYTDPPALAYANNSTANDAPAVAFSRIAHYAPSPQE